MRNSTSGTKIARPAASLAAACLVLAAAQTPAHAVVAATTFHVKNCLPPEAGNKDEPRIFVCSFDKSDGLMNIPYSAKGLKPGDRKEFGCASLGKCKVIIGVSKKHAKHTLSAGMAAAIEAGAVFIGAGAGAEASAASSQTVVTLSAESATEVFDVEVGVAAASASEAAFAGAAVFAVAAAGAIAAIEIGDGWSDGEVCNQVKKAAKKANLAPKHFLDGGKNYRVIEKYAVDKDGNPAVNLDGTAVFAYETTHTLNNCPAPLKVQLVPN